MDLTTHLSGIDMARIVNVKFLTFIILFLISSCRTTSNFVPSNDSQFKNFVKEYKQRNDETPHTHFAMADSDGNCRGALWADFNEEDVKKNAIDLCNSYQGCNQCKIVNFENHSMYVEQAENTSSTSNNYKTYDTSNYKREYVKDDNQKLSKPNEYSIDINSKNYSLFMKCDDKKIQARLNEIKSNFVDFNCNNKDYGTVQSCNFAKKYYQNFEKAPFKTCSELDKAYLDSYLSNECNKKGRRIVESFYLKNRNDHSKEIIYFCSNGNYEYETNNNKNIERDVNYSIPESEENNYEISNKKSIGEEVRGYSQPDFLNNAKKECLELGFKNNTEKFGECVLQLSK